jgi:hypothetical protein
MMVQTGFQQFLAPKALLVFKALLGYKGHKVSKALKELLDYKALQARQFTTQTKASFLSKYLVKGGVWRH